MGCWPSLVYLGQQMHHTYLYFHIYMDFSCGPVYLCVQIPFYKNISPIDLVLTGSSAKNQFPKKIILIGTGGWEVNIFQGMQFKPQQLGSAWTVHYGTYKWPVQMVWSWVLRGASLKQAFQVGEPGRNCMAFYEVALEAILYWQSRACPDSREQHRLYFQIRGASKNFQPF